MKKVFRFRADCGRMGDLHGMFVADDADVAAAVGEYAYFGEVLGKHSEVAFHLTSDQMIEVTGDVAFVENFERFGCASGFNPLQYLGDDEDEDEDED